MGVVNYDKLINLPSNNDYVKTAETFVNLISLSIGILHISLNLTTWFN